MKVFVHCLQVLPMGVSFKSWGWSISHTSQKNACKMCGKLLVLSGLNLSQGCVHSCRTILVCRGKKLSGCLIMTFMTSLNEVMVTYTVKTGHILILYLFFNSSRYQMGKSTPAAH